MQASERLGRNRRTQESVGEIARIAPRYDAYFAQWMNARWRIA
jgi:hypothetical protein